MIFSLNEFLRSNKCFKLICGAGNYDISSVEKLVYLYSKAGCNLFDISADIDIINAAKSGLKKAGIVENRFLCVSVGLSGDYHFNKYLINQNKCNKCGICSKVCLENAIENFSIDEKKCIGCGKCFDICKNNAFSKTPFFADIKQILPLLNNLNIDCIELHSSNSNNQDTFNIWKYISENYKGVLSFCIDRLNYGNNSLIKRTKKMLSIRKPYTTIIQTDGSPISGGINDYQSTLQSVALSDIILKEKLPAYVIASGGTNEKTFELAHQCNIDINGVAVGSYARYIVKDYLSGKMDFDTALNIASKLVNSIKMRNS